MTTLGFVSSLSSYDREVKHEDRANSLVVRHAAKREM
jgi:hypothetical protein